MSYLPTLLTVLRTTLILQQEPVDSHSFAGLHELVFAAKCAQPACHDGSFEPDFRTPQSAYSTLVYHPVVKNDDDNSFVFRVQPQSLNKSWLWERVTTNDQVLGRMPLYDTLAPWQLQLIKEWIEKGAPDVNGKLPEQPNPEPAAFGLVALNSSGERVDTSKGRNRYRPIILPRNTVVDLWWGVYDDATYPPLMTNLQAYISKSALSFDQASEAQVKVSFEPKNFKGLLDQPYPFFLHHELNTGNYQPGTVLYLKLQVQDEHNKAPTLMPPFGTTSYLLSYFSVVIEE